MFGLRRLFHVPRRAAQLVRHDRRVVEPLEPRQLLSGGGSNAGLDLLAAPATQHASAVSSPVPTGYSPQQLAQAYGFNQTSLTGAGETIAIVDAYGDSKIASDLHAFDQRFGLPDPTLTVVNQRGQTQLPEDNSGWALETSLDVEWAHAMAPGANLLLVQASDNSLGNLLAAVDQARTNPGVVAVSMSWGAREFPSEAAFDDYFTTPATHTGITFIAASGDHAGQVLWPAASPNVLSVGGTTLNVDSSGNYLSESGWSDSGGGQSAYEPKPSYQSAVSSSGMRATPDVAYNADPSTGVSVYDSLGYAGGSGWFQVGGTSAGAPQWAALIAVADQGRQAASPSQPTLANAQADLYSLAGNSTSYTADFHAVASDSSGNTASATTFIGSPIANNLVTSLLSAPATPSISLAGIVTAASRAALVSPSDTPADPKEPTEIIIFIAAPRLIDSYVPIVPFIVTPLANNPAPAQSVALPADSPVRLATNSLLVDDPLAVPLKPDKRRASESAPPDELTPESDQPVSPAEVFRVWQSGALDDEDWLAGLLADTGPAAPTADVGQLTDASFADESLFALALDSGDMASGDLALAGLVDAHASPLLGVAGMFLVTMLTDQRRGSENTENTTSRLRLKQPEKARASGRTGDG